MRFRKVLTSIGTLSKAKSYPFDLKEDQVQEGMKRSFENPLLIYEHGSILAIYNDDGELRINYFISYYGFKRGAGDHGIKDSGINWRQCKCGELFRNSKRITALERLDKHLKEIKEEFGNE